MNALQPHVPRRVGLLGGFGYALRGARFVYVQHRRLLWLAFIPLLITAVAFIAATLVAFSSRVEVVNLLWAAPAGEALRDVAVRGLHHALEWLVAVALTAAGAVVVALCAPVIAAPFNDALSEAVEGLYSGVHVSSPLRHVLRDALRSIGLELAKLALYCSVMGPPLVLSWLLPGFGPALYAAIGFLITVAFLAIDYVDFAAARRGLSVGDRLRDARAHWSAMLGLGCAVWVLLFVPLLNVLFMPAAVAGGTLLFVDTHGAATGGAGARGPSGGKA